MVTIACDAKGKAAAEPFTTAAHQQHPSLLDEKLRVAELYGVRNVPAAFWIDENGRMVRANDPIYAQRRNRETGEVTINQEYLNAVRDWVAKGAASAYTMDAKRLTTRSSTSRELTLSGLTTGLTSARPGTLATSSATTAPPSRRR